MSPSVAADSMRAVERAAECAEIARRGVVGGVFYLFGWAVILVYGGLFAHRPWLGSAVFVAFAALAAVRFALARRLPDGYAAQGRRIAVWWAVVLTTAAIWGAASAWCYFDGRFAAARMVALMCTMAYVTALAHALAMRWRPAFAAIVLLIAPSFAWTYRLDDPGAAIVLTVYSAYLVGALRAAHADFLQQRALRRELAEQRDRYAELALLDPLTRLANRREFMLRLERAFADGAPASLMIVDIDHFKRVNDERGHVVGDACLVAFADLLRAELERDGAVLARVGGEEFGVILPGVGQTQAQASAEALRRRLHHLAVESAPDLRGLSVSIGVGERRGVYRRAEEWIVDVDRALYRAKRAGRDRVCQVDVAA